jgi:methylmalonyl-CoA/ethylmalonyl-CoA epimerase
MKVHHVGYAVEDMSGAIEAFESLGYSVVNGAFLDEGRKVRIALLANGPLIVEVVSPAAEGSPIDSILQRAGPGCYHTCYESDDLEVDVSKLRSARFRVVIDAAPALALGHSRVVFLFHRKIGLIELVQKPDNLKSRREDVADGTIFK